jgi:hypothetical protein
MYIETKCLSSTAFDFGYFALIRVESIPIKSAQSFCYQLPGILNTQHLPTYVHEYLNSSEF